MIESTAPDCSNTPETDPFREVFSHPFSVCYRLLGASFRFEGDSEALLQLVDAAYAGVPDHQFPGSPFPAGSAQFSIELRLVPRQAPLDSEPPPVQTCSGAGMLCGVMDAFNYTLVNPSQSRALVVASDDMLRHPYHLRYELIEFAVFMLAARGQGLVPLHGACIGSRGRGVLLLGASGSGKSTLALHSLLAGLDFLAEDAVFVQPQEMLATGVPNYLHMKTDALRFIDDDMARHWISRAPTIRRRSGVAKFEADLRGHRGQLAAAPLKLVGAVFVSSQLADDPDQLLCTLSGSVISARLSTDQPYASSQPGWRLFEQQIRQLGVYELRRGRHPRAGVDAITRLVEPS